MMKLWGGSEINPGPAFFHLCSTKRNARAAAFTLENRQPQRSFAAAPLQREGQPASPGNARKSRKDAPSNIIRLEGPNQELLFHQSLAPEIGFVS
jgi:hypothetical protein